MGVLMKLAVLLAIVAILLGVLVVRCPVPDDLEGKWHARGVEAVTGLLGNLALVGSKLKLGTHIELLQTLHEHALRLYSLFGDDDVKEWWDRFGDIPVMMFEPKNRQKNGPAIVYIHGGGWIYGSPRAYRHVTQTMAKEMGHLVISVDYGLAPKNKYPGPFQDCINAVRHLINHADKYYIDKSKIILAGDSAGGQLTAAITLAMHNQDLKESNINKPLAQILIYPVLQFIDFTLPSYQMKAPPVLSREAVAWFSQLHAFGDVNPARIAAALEGRHISAKHRDRVLNYLDHSKLPKDNFHKDYVKRDRGFQESEYKELEMITMEPSFSPLMAPSLKGLPPTLVLTMEYDVLRDDGYLYVARCRDEGVHVQHINYKQGWHPAMLLRTKLPFHKDIAKFVQNVVEGKPVN